MTSSNNLIAKKKCPSGITQLEQYLINNFQKGFPLCERPYLAIAKQLSNPGYLLSEQAVFSALTSLSQQGVISRTGPVFDHKKAGASTLAALAVSEENLDKIASIVNQFAQVNHNYGRSSHYDTTQYNLWFVVTASDPVVLHNTLTRIELLTGLAVLVLPMEASYHLDLAFAINVTGQGSPVIHNPQRVIPDSKKSVLLPLTDFQKAQLRKLLEAGLPEQLQPFKYIAHEISATQFQVLSQIEIWQKTGLIRRFGLVIKHRKLGFNANAMVVWNIDKQHVDAIAAELAKRDEVSLCYRRPRRPYWPYNLFCMIHGTDRGYVLQQIKELTEQLSLQSIKKDILFSDTAYKQKGACYQQGNSLAINKELAHG